LQDSPVGAFRPVGAVFGDFVPPALDDPGDISSNSPGAPRAISEDSPSKPVDKPDRKQSSADDNRGDVVSGNGLYRKLVVEADKGQAETLADSKDSGDSSSGVSGREWKMFILSGGVAVAEKTSSLCADCRLQNYQIFSGNRNGVLSRFAQLRVTIHSALYLHYAFDLWVSVWRKKWARGEVVVIRYADDTIAGFQYQTDADRFLENLRERLAKFGLELHPDKTRRIEFGRFAEENRKRRGEGKPETFDFLGFTHISGKNRLGRFAVRRLTIRKRMRSKLRELKQQLRPRMHDPVRQTGVWLKSVVQGYFNYYAVPGNIGSLSLFRDRLLGLWWHTLCRRSQKRLPWKSMLKLGARWLPRPLVLHPYPAVRFAATHPR